MLPRRENVIMLKTEAYTDRIIKLYQYMLGVHREQILSKQIEEIVSILTAIIKTMKQKTNN